MSASPLRRTASQIRETIAGWRSAGDSVALVPTMGNLHRGHLSLAELAKQKVDRVVMSVFVNPTQFGVGEDFEAYPRTLAEDRAMLAEAGTVDALFVPDTAEVYPLGVDDAYRIQVPSLGAELCGASRPGHFDGVANVVLRLLHIVWPDVVVFGQKDYQQLVIIERMLADLRIPIGLLSGPTLREDDGLAMSSRNRYLTPEERARAPLLHATLAELCHRLGAGAGEFAELEAWGIQSLQAGGFRPDYVAILSAADLAAPAPDQPADELIVLAAAWLGRARLIDNLAVGG